MCGKMRGFTEMGKRGHHRESQARINSPRKTRNQDKEIGRKTEFAIGETAEAQLPVELKRPIRPTEGRMGT